MKFKKHCLLKKLQLGRMVQTKCDMIKQLYDGEQLEGEQNHNRGRKQISPKKIPQLDVTSRQISRKRILWAFPQERLKQDQEFAFERSRKFENSRNKMLLIKSTDQQLIEDQ